MYMYMHALHVLMIDDSRKNAQNLVFADVNLLVVVFMVCHANQYTSGQ